MQRTGTCRRSAWGHPWRQQRVCLSHRACCTATWSTLQSSCLGSLSEAVLGEGDQTLPGFAGGCASVFQLPSVRERAIKLAQMVATRLGEQGVSSQAFDDHLRGFESKVVSIGKFQLGWCRWALCNQICFLQQLHTHKLDLSKL